jgi:hypothetical protein
MIFETSISLVFFVCLFGAAVGSRVIYGKFPSRYRQEDTQNVVRLVANLFVVMTSLMLGLMVNSSRNAFEAIDGNIHRFATNLIILDRSLATFEPQAIEARQRLLAYTTWAARRTHHDDPQYADRAAEKLLNEVGQALATLPSGTLSQTALAGDIRGQFRNIVELRWSIDEQLEGTIPFALVCLLGAWLVLIFASFGYTAPFNPVTLMSFLVASALIGATIYVLLDMDLPFSGVIKVSPAPLERAIAEMSG